MRVHLECQKSHHASSKNHANYKEVSEKLVTFLVMIFIISICLLGYCFANIVPKHLLLHNGSAGHYPLNHAPQMMRVQLVYNVSHPAKKEPNNYSKGVLFWPWFGHMYLPIHMLFQQYA